MSLMVIGEIFKKYRPIFPQYCVRCDRRWYDWLSEIRKAIGSFRQFSCILACLISSVPRALRFKYNTEANTLACIVFALWQLYMYTKSAIICRLFNATLSGLRPLFREAAQ